MKSEYAYPAAETSKKAWSTPALETIEMTSTAGGQFPTDVENPPFSSEFVAS